MRQLDWKHTELGNIPKYLPTLLYPTAMSGLPSLIK